MSDKNYDNLPVPTYNGFRLPGYDSKFPVSYNSPRWMIVWDKAGWTKPVRRIVVMFNGKFLDTDGNYWDFGSDIPDEYKTKELQDYWKIPDNMLSPEARKWSNVVQLLPNPGY